MFVCSSLKSSFLRPWNHCESVQDYLSIFDGKSTEFPELARICGGDSLPDIISSGPDMLIVFQTSPFDSLFHPTPVSYLLGFELQVEVRAFCLNCRLIAVFVSSSSCFSSFIPYRLSFIVLFSCWCVFFSHHLLFGRIFIKRNNYFHWSVIGFNFR